MDTDIYVVKAWAGEGRAEGRWGFRVVESAVAGWRETMVGDGETPVNESTTKIDSRDF